MNINNVQSAFQAIQQLASLCSTEGIEQDTKTAANIQIRKFISIVEKEATSLAASAAGIITRG